MLDSTFWLLALGVLGLMALVYFVEKRSPDIWPPKQAKTDAHCAWCVHRDGLDCTNTSSPVYPGPCGPICIGEQGCAARDVRL